MNPNGAALEQDGTRTEAQNDIVPKRQGINPYEADPKRIPKTDRYITEPFYGRYHPQPDDFKPDPRYVNATSAEALEYWASVLEKCDESNRIYESQEGGRDVFALGSVIVKSSHLKSSPGGRRGVRDYSYADANEVEAVKLAQSVLFSAKVPQIYFANKINGRDVLIQQRIAGVGLNIAWQYISKDQKFSFKNQAREILHLLHAVKPPSGCGRPSYIVPDHDPVAHRGIQDLEHFIIFSARDQDTDLRLMHNDFSMSNCIVDNDKIVGLVDWEMAGWFGWRTAAEVHEKIRMPKRQNFANLKLSEERLGDILFWNDLYVKKTDAEDRC